MISKNERTLDNLRERLIGTIYIVAATKEISTRLKLDAQRQGYKDHLGRKPSQSEGSWHIVTLHNDKRISLGWGMWTSISYKGSKDCYRIDYERYISGKYDYLYHDYIDGRSLREVYTFDTDFHGKMRISGPRYKEAHEFYENKHSVYDTPEKERRLFDLMEQLYTVIVIK